MPLKDDIQQETLAFFRWFVSDGCCDNPTSELLDEQLERADRLRVRWENRLSE